MSRNHKRVLWSVSASSLALLLSLLPGQAWACWFGGCGGCGGGSTFAGRLITPMRAAFGPPVVYESPMVSDAGCGSCGVAMSDSCSSCGTSYAEPSLGECQPAPAQIESGKSPTLVEPKDRWKKKTYAPDEAPLGGTSPESSGDSDAIRGGAGPSGAASETPATPPRGGIPADSEDSSRSTFRPETPAPRTQTVPESEPRIRIEPRGSRGSSVPTPEESVTPIPSNRPSTTEPAASEPAAPQPGHGGLSLPQASRLDHMVAGDPPARSRTVIRKPARGGQLVRNAEYSRRPWNSETSPATVARNP
jgi:hypothetical protein